MRYLLLVCFVGLALLGCDDTSPPTDGATPDGSTVDARVTLDGGRDAGPLDAGPDAGSDAGPDGGRSDACVPSCAARSCGEDGCGGSCGTCGDGHTCSGAGRCEPSCDSGCTTGCVQGCFDLGACTGGAGTLDLHANVHTLGVVADGSDMRVHYRAVGATHWWQAPEAATIPGGRVATSLFSLPPDTPFEVRAEIGGTVYCATATTQPLVPVHATRRTLYVAPGGSGDGSEASPFGSIQQAVDAATPGTDIRVAEGIYHESVNIGVSGEPGAYIRLIGDDAILDGSDQDVARDGLSWTAQGDNVYRAPWSGDPRYLNQNETRYYHYLSLEGLQNGIGDDDEPINTGFFVDGGQLYVRTAVDPDSATWQVPVMNRAFRMDGQSHVWIEGFDIRFYGEGAYPMGIDVRDSDDVVLRDNAIYGTPAPINVRRGSNRVRVEDNYIFQTPGNWPWPAVKGTDHENTAISLSGGRGAIVTRNTIFEIFNGIGSGSFSDDMNPALAYDVDVYANRLARIGDDGLEPEGACVNNRYWGNVVDRVLSGVSLAPITYGPVWVLRNRFTDFDGTGFKVSNHSTGRVWMLHNTAYTGLPDQNGMNVSGPFTNMVFRNNILVGTRYALEMSQVAQPNDLDYDNLYTPRGAPVIKWSNVRYDSVADWCAADGLECHAVTTDPQLLFPELGEFSLTESSPNIDAAERLYGINDAYTGSGPDIGYVEFGSPEPLPAE